MHVVAELALYYSQMKRERLSVASLWNVSVMVYLVWLSLHMQMTVIHTNSVCASVLVASFRSLFHVLIYSTEWRW